jgi:UDP-4-amino-4,6-dideoxy-N-acetyl-beta-L-altrosamine transaminase
MIPYGHHSIDVEDIKAVIEVLRSDFLTQGPKVKEFEAAFARSVGSRYAVAVNNGTAALHLACLAAGIGPGDEVITSPISFVASANCALYVGATPVFIDIDSSTLNMSPPALKAYLDQRGEGLKEGARASRRRPKALIPVHYGGFPCDMLEINRIGREHGLTIIEDACHALGASYRLNNPHPDNVSSAYDAWIGVGSCVHSHMAVFSFHPVKHITTGEGGMITTNDEELYDRLLLFRNHGITRNPVQFENLETERDEVPPWYYEMQVLGHNYRITDLQAALGLSQLKRADHFLAARRQIASHYLEGLKHHPRIQCPQVAEDKKSAFHLFPIRVDFNAIGRSRGKVMEVLKEKGIGTQVHYIPIPSHPYYKGLGFTMVDYPESEKFYGECLSLPIYPDLESKDVDRIVETLWDIL